MAKLVIDGIEYDLSFDFDLGEARVIKRYAGITLNQLATHDESDPDLVAAFIHIVFKRRWPEVEDSEIEARVNKVKLASIDMRVDEVDARPPASAQSEPAGNGSSSGASSEPGVEPIRERSSPGTSGLRD